MGATNPNADDVLGPSVIVRERTARRALLVSQADRDVGPGHGTVPRPRQPPALTPAPPRRRSPRRRCGWARKWTWSGL